MLQSYKNLRVWQYSVNLVSATYTLTSQFPKEETYGLAAQMRRAAVSIPSNIAEGARRKDLPEYLQFLRIADASSAELETQVVIAKKIYPELDYSDVVVLLGGVQRMLNVLIRKLNEKSQKPKTQNLKPTSGFTLAELLVAIGLFSVVVTIAMGGLVQAMRTQHQVAALIAADNNASLALEQMAREVRTGYSFCHQDSNCYTPPDGDGFMTTSALDFTNAEGQAVVYSLADGILEKSVKGGASQQITSRSVIIKYLTFILHGNLPDDGWPPRITILMGVSTPVTGVSGSVVNLETTVSARQIDT